jgi:hypothetical protein
MEAVVYFETSVHIYQTACCRIPKDGTRRLACTATGCAGRWRFTEKTTIVGVISPCVVRHEGP